MGGSNMVNLVSLDALVLCGFALGMIAQLMMTILHQMKKPHSLLLLLMKKMVCVYQSEILAALEPYNLTSSGYNIIFHI